MQAAVEGGEHSRLVGRGLVGSTILVRWPSEMAWFQGTVTAYSGRRDAYSIQYEDGDQEWLPLNEACSDKQWRVLGMPMTPTLQQQQQQQEEGRDDDGAGADAAAAEAADSPTTAELTAAGHQQQQRRMPCGRRWETVSFIDVGVVESMEAFKRLCQRGCGCEAHNGSNETAAACLNTPSNSAATASCSAAATAPHAVRGGTQRQQQHWQQQPRCCCPRCGPAIIRGWPGAHWQRQLEASLGLPSSSYHFVICYNPHAECMPWRNHCFEVERPDTELAWERGLVRGECTQQKDAVR